MNIDSSFIFNGISDTSKNFIKNIIKECNKHNIDAYLVGGYLRDYILSQASNDIDIVFVGDSKKILHYIDLNFTNYEYSQDFKTIKVIVDNLEFDLITARKESYNFPGSLPVISPSNIVDDLNRRDFTINSMALKLNSFELTQVLDIKTSKLDLDNKLIKVHHSFSFIDDPTRIFRAFRYAARYNFTIEEETKNLIEYEIKKRRLKNISYTRIFNELVKDFKEPNYESILEFYKSYDIYDIMFSDSLSRSFLLAIHKKFYMSKYKKTDLSAVDIYKSSLNLLSEEELISLIILVCINISDTIRFEHFSKNISRKICKIATRISNILNQVYSNDDFKIFKSMEILPLEERHILLYFIDDIIFSRLLNILSCGKNSKAHINVVHILRTGIEKKYINEILNEIHRYKFEEKMSIRTRIEEDMDGGYLEGKDDLQYLKIIIDRRSEYYFNESRK